MNYCQKLAAYEYSFRLKQGALPSEDAVSVKEPEYLHRGCAEFHSYEVICSWTGV